VGSSVEKILITQPLPAVATDWLRAQGAELLLGYESDAWRSHADEIRAIVYYSIPIDKAFMDSLPKLEIIGKRGAGVDRIDLKEATRRNIRITNVAGANSTAVSEHAVMLLFAATRGVILRDGVTRAGRFEERFDLPLCKEISATNLGLIGFGNIGRRVAGICQSGFGCAIGFYDPYVDGSTVADDVIRFDDLAGLLGWADNAIVVAPLTPETRGMIGLPELEMLGPDGVIVIVSRGGIVDEDALAESLARGSIRGAGIDVYDHEPPREDHPLFALENVVLTPHVAGATDTSRDQSSLLTCQRVWALLHGGDAPIVGRESWNG
jgi:D-3-phosphoglycerate dehydrogenase / 2-oxoglutarate reductase